MTVTVYAGPTPITVAELTTGSGLRIDSVTEAVADGDAWLTAEIVTVFGLGKTIGAVYSPEAEIVPVADEPPAVPFTCQVTLV